MVEERNEEPLEGPHKKSFVDRLQKATTELNSIQTSFSKGMNELERIQSMLSLDGVNSVTTMIQDFEDRISEAEKRREEASEGARRFGEELEKEKERLIKLWDAYKNQEEELATQEKRASELETKLREIEQSRIKFEEDANARIATLSQKLSEKEGEMQNVQEFKQRIQDFDGIRNQLEETIGTLKSDITEKDERIQSLENRVQDLQQFEGLADVKVKFDEVSEEFEKEKERLTKLFRLYEDTETENRKLKDELKGWQEWFASNEEIFNKLFTTVDHLRQKSSTDSKEIEENLLADSEIETKKKQKRKLRLRK